MERENRPSYIASSNGRCSNPRALALSRQPLAGIAIGVQPVGQGIDQPFGSHVIAQQLAQLALGPWAILPQQGVDVEAAVLVDHPQLRLAGTKVVAPPPASPAPPAPLTVLRPVVACAPSLSSRGC
ncbi:hypothetical protein WR25_18473 [Diploscapter pachys]|uniref:Uncharacterized protein n=1 Tax=Diploscapter pachys TaxID=2018661 RepID=A0A2A2KES7_9BILA|nr:hypothetical protein WR25_18473 [Diploscapter pachys]